MAKKIFTISPYCYNELINRGFDLNALYLLSLLSEGIDVSAFNNGKIAAYQQLLVRRDLITESMELTQSGIELLEFCSTTSKKLTLKKLNTDDDFLKWWDEYPGSDGYIQGNKSFPATRSLKKNKEECRIKFNKLLNEGYKAEDLLRALRCEVTGKKKKSIASGENKMSYMQNTLSYLNQRTFEGFLEISKSKMEEGPSNKSSVVDI